MPGNTSDNREHWQKNTLEPVIRRFPERREQFQTDSGIPIDPLYGPVGPAAPAPSRFG